MGAPACIDNATMSLAIPPLSCSSNILRTMCRSSNVSYVLGSKVKAMQLFTSTTLSPTRAHTRICRTPTRRICKLLTTSTIHTSSCAASHPPPLTLLRTLQLIPMNTLTTKTKIQMHFSRSRRGLRITRRSTFPRTNLVIHSIFFEFERICTIRTCIDLYSCIFLHTYRSMYAYIYECWF